MGVECYLEPLAQIMSMGKGEGVDQASGPLNIRDENTEGRGSWGPEKGSGAGGGPRQSAAGVTQRTGGQLCLKLLDCPVR